MKKAKVFYGQEPQNGKSTTTECGVGKYQLLAVIYWSSPMGNSWCSRPQPVTHNGVRDGMIQLTGRTPTLIGSAAWEPRA